MCGGVVCGGQGAGDTRGLCGGKGGGRGPRHAAGGKQSLAGLLAQPCHSMSRLISSEDSRLVEAPPWRTRPLPRQQGHGISWSYFIS